MTNISFRLSIGPYKVNPNYYSVETQELGTNVINVLCISGSFHACVGKYNEIVKRLHESNMYVLHTQEGFAVLIAAKEFDLC